MEQLTRKDVLKIARDYYRNDGLTGWDPSSGGCLYFTDDGGHCAVGAVLKHLGYAKDDLELGDRDLNEATNAGEVLQKLDGFRARLLPEVYKEEESLVDLSPVAKGCKLKTRSFLEVMQERHDRFAEMESEDVSQKIADSLGDLARKLNISLD